MKWFDLSHKEHNAPDKVELIVIHKFAAPDDVADLDFPNSEVKHEEDHNRLF